MAASGSFVHLHCHTHYSLLDGASRIPELVKRVKGEGMNSVAITDHGNLYGAIEFYRECKAGGINPIIGYEAYVAPGKRTEREAKKRGEAGFHLTLLAQNATGFKNLIKLATIAFTEGYYYIPRIDKELLEAHKDGLICLSGCASSEFSEFILKDQRAEAKRLAEYFAKLFDKNFYVEIQSNGLEIQRQCAEGAIDIANQLGLPLVATSDAHYLTRDDAPSHDILLCINTGRTRDDPNRMRYGSDLFYVRGPKEMYELFPGHADAVQRSQEIADGVDIQLDFKKRHFPVYTPPEGKTPEQYLRELCAKGLTERYGENPSERVRDRLEHELGVICRMGFASYFLIVGDFVRFAVEKGIPTTARGSACGAMVSYVLKLSHVCPLEYDLLFERFLDPNRAEAPDIDIDFCQDRRELVIQYVREKYGAESVAQIGTFGTLAARQAIKDVGRALNIPLERVIQLTKMIPEILGISIKDSLKQSVELKQAYDGDPDVHELLDIAMNLEGTNRNMGTHAAGVVIGNGPLVEHVPLQRPTRKGDDGARGNEGAGLTTQWVMGDLEKVGLLKMDFLGLRTLTLLDNAVRMIKRTRGITIDLQALPLDDPETYLLLQKGDAKGVFQLESDGIRELLKRMRPDNIRDLIAILALYRPGPLEGGMVDTYVNCKHGREVPQYAHPVMKDVLEETFGVMCIHEDTRIAMADGTEKPIREVRAGDWVHSLNHEARRFDVRECHGCGPTRREDGLRLTLENGFSVVLTDDHNVLTYGGMKEVGKLDLEKDLIAVGVHTPQDGPTGERLAPWLGEDEDVAYLLGLLIGDGCLTGTGVTIATGTQENHDKLVAWFRERLPSLELHAYHHCRSWYLGIKHPELLNSPAYGNRKKRFVHWIETLGLRVKAAQKRVPTAIFRGASSVRAAFLAGLIDADGCLAETNSGGALVSVTTISPALREDLRRLAQLEGIPVRLSAERVHFWDAATIAQLVEPFLQLKTFKGKRNGGRSVGWIPREEVLAVVRAFGSARGFCRATGCNRRSLGHNFPFVKSSTALKAGFHLGDVRYHRIKSIERVNGQQFYGMSVDEHHNLVANGIVVKNCYQEQIMRILNRLGGIELSSAYACIKAISKKKTEIIDQRKVEFLKGAVERGVTEETAEEIFRTIVVFGGYGFNKCIVGSTIVQDALTGERITVRDLFAEERSFTVHAKDANGRLVPRSVERVVWNGRKPVFRLTTELGKTITATGNHPFWTLNGWKNLEELHIGDRVAAPRILRVPTEKSWPSHELIVLGGLLSEGNTCHPSCLYYYNNDSILIDDFAQSIEQFPHTVARIDHRLDGRHEVCASTGRGSGRAQRTATGTLPQRSGAYDWAQRLGILAKKANAKFIPAEVFTLRDADVAILLGRMWAGDGHICSKTLMVPFYATSSERLANDVQSLLLRFGIVSRIHRKQFKYRGTLRAGYTVHLLGVDAQERFLEYIAPHCPGRTEAIERLRNHVAVTQRGATSKDTLPAEVRDWVDEARRQKGWTWKELEERSDVSIQDFQGALASTKRGFRRETIRKLAEVLDSDRLRAAASSDIFWDRVVSIEPAGIEDTFDLTVAEDHNFVADGLIVHNSHTAAYAKVGYQTAYLKTHFRPEFMAALLSSEVDDGNKRDILVEHIADARRLGVEVLPPNINTSETDFSVHGGKIVFGLVAIKGVGRQAAEEIVRARQEKGPFRDLFDLCERVDLKITKAAALEKLVKAGAFDCLWMHRAQVMHILPRAIQAATERQKDKRAGQKSLFDAFAASETSNPAAATTPESHGDAAPWSETEKLKYEKEVLDFYFSSHPLAQHERELRRYATHTAEAIKTAAANDEVLLGGMLTLIRLMNYKKPRKDGNNRYMRCKVEDITGSIECVMWADVFARYKDEIAEDRVLFVQGKVERAREEPSLVLTRIFSLDQAAKEMAKNLNLLMHLGRSRLAEIDALAEILQRSPGPVPVLLTIRDPFGRTTMLKLSRQFAINPQTFDQDALENLLGAGSVKLT